MEEGIKEIVETAPNLSRKRTQQKSSWKTNREKESRYSPKRPPDIKIPCKHYSESYKCTSLRKKDIIMFHAAFYKSKNKIDQDNFIIKHTKATSTQRRRPVTGAGKKKNLSIKYCARRRNMLIPVCRSTFLHILGIKKGRANGVIMRHFKSNGESAQENRGGNQKERKYADIKKAIKTFIKTLVPLEIHYCRSQIKSRQYLSSNLNINKLYKMFISQADERLKNTKASYFRRIFNTCFNIGFGTPRTDVCSTCLTLQEQMKHEKDNNKKKDLMITKRVHGLRAKAFYNLLKEERDDLLTMSFDCQKNQPNPKVPDQSTYYSRQLYVYNFTVVVGSSKTKLTTENVFIYTWTEDILPKASNEIASAVFHCLCNSVEKYQNVTTVRLVADGCTGQNKNTSMLGMVCKYLMDYAPNRIKTIEIVFPIVGHSFLPPDRVFAQIEKKIKKTETIPNPDGYYEIFKDHGTVLKMGTEVEVTKWKEASKLIIKPTTAMHFAFKKSKRFFIKRNKQKNNAVVRAEESYHNRCGNFKNICRVRKSVSQIHPVAESLFVDVKKCKLDDVRALLKTHYGPHWENLPELKYYQDVLERPAGTHAHADDDDEGEPCEMMEELPNLIV